MSKLTEKNQETAARPEWEPKFKVSYKVEDIPPTAICLLLGFQHYLSMCISALSVPILLAPAFCMENDQVGKSELTGTLFVASGIITLFQSVVGIRLPIIQTGTFSLMVPTISYFSLPEWQCPNIINEGDTLNVALNDSNNSFIITGSEEHRSIWQDRVREVQGCIMLAALFEVFIGLTGLVGMMMRFIGPLTICPTITLIGLTIFKSSSDMASKHWGIAILTMVAMIILSQCMSKIRLPCYLCSRKGCEKHKFPIFKMFPVILAIILLWILCYLLTVTEVLPKDPSSYGYYARTDIRISSILASPWFRVPYPGQWGMPTASISGVIALMSGIIASIIESVGDYYSCAKMSGVPPPPVHAINRGILTEGLGNFLAGILGSGNGTTSSSVNIGILGITKVASRSVIVVAALFMIVFGVFIKFGVLFLSIPDPIIGGSFFILFGMIVAVGLSNLQQVDLSSSRNLFIIGTSLFAGLAIPQWFIRHQDFINTGNVTVDNIAAVLLKTSMFVGGVTGFILDNSIPGSRRTRGMLHWVKLRSLSLASDSCSSDEYLNKHLVSTYEIKTLSKWMEKFSLLRYFPFLPTYRKVISETDKPLCCRCCEEDDDDEDRTKSVPVLMVNSDDICIDV